MENWNVADVCAFVASLLPGSPGLYRDCLCEHEVDGGALSALDNVSSKGFELLQITKYGHVHKIASAVAAMKLKASGHATAEIPTSPSAAAAAAAAAADAAKAKASVEHSSGKGGGGLFGRLGSPGKAGGVVSSESQQQQQIKPSLDLPAPPPNEFFCPISFEMMSEPVVASDGHTYERLDIERWFRNTHQVKGGGALKGGGLTCSSPMTGECVRMMMSLT
jgi:hypothetical protein